MHLNPFGVYLILLAIGLLICATSYRDTHRRI